MRSSPEPRWCRALAAAVLLGAAVAAGGCHILLPYEQRSAPDGSSGSDGGSPADGGIDLGCGIFVTCPDLAGISAGGRHTCAWTTDGVAWCWGDGKLGQLGDGRAADSIAAVKVDFGAEEGRVTRVVAGRDHSCAIVEPDASGDMARLYCWGDNSDDQVVPSSGPDVVPTPTRVDAVGAVGAVALAHRNTCATDAQGTRVRCWGFTGNGITGPSTSSSTDGLYTVHKGQIAHLACGQDHCCAQEQGAVCWGSSTHGQAGTIGDAVAPTPIKGLPKTAAVTRVACGGEFCCALLSDGAVRCWGAGGTGQHGDGKQQASAAEARPVSGLTGIIGLGAGYSHACAHTAGGEVRCWGYNRFGQVGVRGDVVATPRQIEAARGARQLAGGAAHSCALLPGGRFRCWGSNVQGQLGDGRALRRAAPAPVKTSHELQRLSLGGHHSCLIDVGGHPRCFGYNDYGQLGDGTRENRATPVGVGGALSGAWAAVVPAGLHSCGVRGGRVWCWGANWTGQLGTGDVAGRTLPAAATLGKSVAGVTGGLAHSCAVTAAGAVYCWGSNRRGQLGSPGPDATEPRKVAALANVAAVSAGGDTSCALTRSGQVRCWGDNRYGQLGVDPAQSSSSSDPLGISLSTAKQVAVGGRFACALGKSGAVGCWGMNTEHQLGASTPWRSWSALQVQLDPVEQITAGWAHACALQTDGEVLCWGANQAHQLGRGDVHRSASPRRVEGLPGTPDAIHAGWTHTCARIGTTAHCWGSTQFGELGAGARAAPLPEGKD